jgi:hypothetical protein
LITYAGVHGILIGLKKWKIYITKYKLSKLMHT